MTRGWDATGQPTPWVDQHRLDDPAEEAAAKAAVARPLARPPRPVTVDCETHGIEGRPAYPPVAVGVSIKWPGRASRYYAWGHLSGNNCSWGDARAALAKAYGHPAGLLFQNGKFDTDVIEVEFGLPLPAWQQIHDTLFLLFLDDPHQRELGLKPSAARLLGQPPEEQDAVADWLVERQPVPGVKISRSKQSDHYFMKYLGYAPGAVVGHYADGDVDRTHDLFALLWPRVVARGMLAAYDRERELMPILLEMERGGVPVDLTRLDRDVETYIAWTHRVEAWIVRRLKADPDINLASGEQLMAAMVEAGKVDLARAPLTDTGKYQTNKAALLLAVTDRTLLAALKYRAQLHTCLQTFMIPWLRVAEASGGLIFTTWNQVKGDVGTRSGRLSSQPNFQNIPLVFKAIWRHEEEDPKKAGQLPVCPLDGLPPLPSMRGYIVAPPGYVLCGRDFMGQELRILAHFEDGAMRDSYLENPTIDFHQYAADLITETTGRVITRKITKNISFSVIYGSGIGALAESLGATIDEAKAFKKAYLAIFPGIKAIQDDLKARARRKEPLRTWGGREYFCEEPKIIDGRLKTFEYKMLNYLVQPSAADITKDAMIKFHRARPQSRMLLTVHDELMILARERRWQVEMRKLKASMNSCELGVPMLSDGEVGQNWKEMIECE